MNETFQYRTRPQSEGIQYHWQFAPQVIANLVIRRKEVEAVLLNLLSAVEEEASHLREQNERSLFTRKFASCGNTFSHTRQKLRDHEATHGVPVSVGDSQEN